MMAPLWKEIPPPKYGGSELIVSMLTEELVAQGHDVTLFACGGSSSNAMVIEVIPRPMFELIGGKFDFSAIQSHDLASLDMVIRAHAKKPYDVIHNHLGHHIALLGHHLGLPMVTTLHSSVEPDFESLAEAAKDAKYVSISHAQRNNYPAGDYIETVYHGINIAEFEFSDQKSDYLLYVATLSQDKGADRAIKIAQQSGKKLIMAGDIRSQSYFDSLKSSIDGKQIKYIGEVNVAEKVKLFRDAQALLLPIRWNEAFGLVVAEAYASGTPVIAYPNGAMPEIIEHGKTGFLIKSITEGVAAVNKLDTISHQYCLDYFHKRFSVFKMAENYLKVYGIIKR